MQTLWQDVRYGLRMLRRNWSVSAIVVVTLALGIGANTAIFSVVNAVLLRPLPYTNPDRLVSLWEKVPNYGRWRVAPANYLDWKKQNTVFDEVAAFGGATMTLTSDGEPEQLLGTRCSAGYFSTVGVTPQLGRQFLAEEYEPGKGHVVILGHSFWLRRYRGDKQIVNKSITLNGEPYTVVGVMPDAVYPVWPTTSGHLSFDPSQEQFWVPMSFSAEWAGVRTAHVLGVLGRLKPGVTVEQAQGEMNLLGARLAAAYPANKDEGIIVNRFQNEVVGEVRPALITLQVSVGLVLLIACANIAGLLLSLHAARSKEIAIRAALGASRFRLVRQFFLEGLLLTIIGTAAGVWFAKIGVDSLLRFIPQQIPRLSSATVDLRVLLFTLSLSLATCLVFGLVPAWHASKPSLQSSIEHGARTSGGGGRQRLRQLLVVMQIALAVMLVIAAGLLSKSFWRLRQVDPGFNPEHVLSVELTLPASKYSDNSQINGFYDQLTDRIAHLPGVSSTAIAYDHPLQSSWVDSFSIEGRPSQTESLSADFAPVSWNYFRTAGIAILNGRGFDAKDDPDHPGVVVVSQAFARRYFPNEPVLGQRLKLSAPARIWNNQRFSTFEIVGVARDVKSAGLQSASEPTYYVPAAQAPLQDMTILVRTVVEPTSLVPAIRQAVWEIDVNQPIVNISTMEKLAAESVAQPRLNMLLMGIFGSLALLLAAVGIYGLLSYAVAQRTREMGIRMALGAQVKDVLILVLREGMTLVLVGEVIGLASAFATTRLIRNLLFGVGPNDAAIFIGVFGGLTLVALFACFFPARRATTVDPLVALRYE